MSDNDNKPPDLPDSNKEDDRSSSDFNLGDKCENPPPLMDYKNIMLKNKSDLKKKEEVVQEYAEKLTKIKSKVKSRRSADTNWPSVNETMSPSKFELSGTKTSSSKSHLLQQKLEENRKIFEQRNKDLIESKRADEVKLEEIRQQLNSEPIVNEDSNLKYLIDDKDKKIFDLSNKIMELESLIVDLKDNLNNKDSVIESKTKAITLVSDNLSLKSKETLDQLADTKDEMRNMQENFIQLESSFKIKIDSLITDIEERDKKITELEEEIHKPQESVSTETDETLESNQEVDNLKKELEELNKSMIKMKAQNKSKLKNLQKRLDSYQKSADPNDQVVNLINQVAILEEEKGNLQLSLVDFDDIKATNQELQTRISELSEESDKQKLLIQEHIDTISLLESQKSDLAQELEEVKQESLKLKSENSECENLRVTAELKVVDLEEQLEVLHKKNSKTDETDFVDNEMLAKLNDLQDKFNLAMQEKVLLEEKLNNFTSSASTEDQEVALMSLKTEIVNLKQLNEEQRVFIDEIQLLLSDNQMELAEKNKMLHHYEGLIDNCTKIQGKLTDLLIKIDAGDISSLEERLDDHDSIVSKLEKQVQEKNKIIEELKAQLESLNSEKENIVGKLNLKYDEDVNMLTKLMSGLNSELEDTKNQSDLDKSRIESLEESLRLRELEIEEGKKLIEELNLKIEEKSEECMKLLREGSDDKVEKIDNLTNKILDKEQVIETFLKEKEMLEGKIHEETVKNNEQMWVIEDLNNQIYKLKAEMGEKEANLMSMLNEKETLESKWRHEVSENQGKLERLNELAEEIDSLNSKLIDVEAKFNEIFNEKMMLEDKIKDSEDKLRVITDLEREIDMLKNDLSSNDNLIESLTREKEALEAKVTVVEDLNNELVALKTKLADKDSEIVELSREKEILREELQVKENELRAIDDLHRELENVKSKLAEKDEMIESILKDKEILEDQLGQSEGKLKVFNDANHELEIMRHRVKKSEEIIESMSREKGMLEEMLSEKDERIRSFDQMSQEMEMMKNQMMADKEVMESIYSDKSVLEDRIKEEMNENQSLLMKIRELLAQIEELKRELRGREAELEENFRIVDDVKMQLRNQSEYSENLKVQIDSSNRMIEQIKITHVDEINALRSQMDSTTQDLEVRLKEIEDLKAALSDREKLIGNNLTEEVKIELENKIFELERQLEDAHNNSSSQLQKMKIIAANLKKKSIQCQEYEMKLSEYDEKWENEAKEKDLVNEKLVKLEAELVEKNKQTEELDGLLKNSVEELEALRVEHENLRIEFTRVETLLQENIRELTATKEEHERLREEMKERVEELEMVRAESSRSREEIDNELEETREKARELGVRMQVMEGEYLEHLNTIQMLRTENGMLMSKHAQWNEKLENTELDYEKKVRELEEVRGKLQEECERKNELLKDNEVKLEEMVRVVEELEKKNRNLEEQIAVVEELKIKNNKLEEEIALVEELKMQKKDLEEQIAVVEELKSKNNKLEEEIALVEDLQSTNKKLEEQIAVIEDLKNKNSKLEEEILIMTEIKARNKDLEEQIEVMSRERLLMTAKLDSMAAVQEPEVVKEEILQNLEQVEEPDVKLGDEEEWGWNAQEAEIPGVQITPFCTQETQMQAKIAELQDTIKDLEDEKSRLSNEFKAMQIKNAKLIKKVKEFKIHNDNLSQQLKLQINSNKFSDLDSAIEEELKSQVTQLEQNLSKTKSESEKIAGERDNLLKRIDVLMAANESFLEMKERQDRDIEVMVIRNKELSNKIHLLESRAQGSGEKIDDSHEHGEECVKCKEKINELQENLELLSNENEELRRLIEHEKMELSIQKKEIEESRNLAEGMKVNFYDMLEKSFTKEKSCLDNLSEVTEIKENVEENLESTLKEERLKVQQLEGRIKADGELISKLNSQVEGLNSEVAVKETLVSEVRGQLEQVEAALKAQVELKDQLEFERDNLLHSIQELNERIYQSDSKLQRATEELADRDSNILRIENSLGELQRQLEAVNEERDQLRVSCDQLADEIRLKIEEIEVLKVKAGEFEEFKVEHEKHLQVCQSVQIKCLDDLEGVSVEKTRIEESLLSLASQVSGKSLESTEKDLRIRSLEEDLAKLEKERDNYLKSSQETESKLTEITDAMANVTELLGVRVQEVADLKQYIKTLEIDRLSIDDLNAEIRNLNSRLEGRDTELEEVSSKLKNELTDKIEEINSLQSRLEELSRAVSNSGVHEEENKLLKETINNNEVLIGNLRVEIRERDDKIAELQRQVEECNEEIVRMNHVIADYEESSSLSVKKITELTEEISRIRSLEAEIGEIKAEHQQTVNSLQNTVLESKQAIDQVKNQLNVKDEEIEDLKYILNESTYPGIIQELQNKIDTLYQEKNQLTLALMKQNKDFGDINMAELSKMEEKSELGSSELDVALYMLHQRDVRCEELTHELMQLLEERDTLQLRLSNAIRINEELRKFTPGASKLEDDADSVASQETDAAPVSSQSEVKDKEILAEKLTQLHNVGHRKDIRLKDERELRHTQQMSLIAHKEALSTLPPDAAARLINAKYTVSRDVQSQSSVLLNWLWGKSTPKVVHM
ncbi:putative leucine-rich repeat-containing protein DDB_G0290503 isoform X3 [Cotesia glomerata]|nr:putative leucine-rich repeat-containing protein DDB_G0290503 isoform X3 [Cotesia glomerata]XP_044594093.1 putative leucine-rich repeat-containing protein DDB_G0290503 isoform X3 [Cotesia glomerata]XP_044594094.1 putative leucine-rich repeat-containing protein DDB_G0290503 isoform X3 [Cotesia glomerata]XP_044594095.1 putative leucine-rich repeat-containing protein DDB_G0290503 isoform X3 [Cotesia glomerata]